MTTSAVAAAASSYSLSPLPPLSSPLFFSPSPIRCADATVPESIIPFPPTLAVVPQLDLGLTVATTTTMDTPLTSVVGEEVLPDGWEHDSDFLQAYIGGAHATQQSAPILPLSSATSLKAEPYFVDIEKLGGDDWAPTTDDLDYLGFDGELVEASVLCPDSPGSVYSMSAAPSSRASPVGFGRKGGARTPGVRRRRTMKQKREEQERQLTTLHKANQQLRTEIDDARRVLRAAALVLAEVARRK